MNQKVMVGAVALLGALGIWNAWTMNEVTKAMNEMKKIENASLAIQKPSEDVEETAKKITEKITELKKKKNALKKEVNAESSDQLDEIDSQIKDLQNQANTSGAQTYRTERPKNVGMVMSALKDPTVKKEISNIAKEMAKQEEASKWQAKREVNSEARQFEMDNFAKEKGYSDSVTSQLNEVVSQYSEESSGIWRQVNDGEISWMDARTEWKDLKSERETKLTDIIGEGDYKELQERVWGRWR